MIPTEERKKIVIDDKEFHPATKCQYIELMLLCAMAKHQAHRSFKEPKVISYDTVNRILVNATDLFGDTVDVNFKRLIKHNDY